MDIKKLLWIIFGFVIVGIICKLILALLISYQQHEYKKNTLDHFCFRCDLHCSLCVSVAAWKHAVRYHIQDQANGELLGGIPQCQAFSSVFSLSGCCCS
jgi:hypothetical protein